MLIVQGMGHTAGTGPGTCAFNGVSMTLAGKVQVPSDRWIYLFYLLNPDNGSSHNVVFTDTDTSVAQAVAASYTGVGSYESNANTGTDNSVGTLNVSVTTVAANAWVIASTKTAGTANTAGTNTSFRQTGSFLTGIIERSDNPIASPGSTAVQITGYTVGGAIVSASFAPAGAAAGQPTMRRWGGVPAMGGQGIGNKGPGRSWGKTRSGIYVPRRFAA